MIATWLVLGSTVAMALREIRRNVLRSVLTTLGIVIGVAAGIALVTLGEGATARVTGELAGLGVNMLAVVAGSERDGPGMQAARPLTVADVRAIQQATRDISGVAPSVIGEGLAVYQNKSWQTTVRGTTNAFFEVRSVQVDRGRVFSDTELAGGTPVCVLGHSVAEMLFGKRNALGEAIRIGRVACSVIAITVAKGQSTFGDDQDDYVLMPLKAVQRRVTGNQTISSISVSAVSAEKMDKVKAQLVALMRERRHLAPAQEDDFLIFDSREIIETVQSITGILTVLLGAIAAISLIVGGIGIMNIMLVAVTERTREIGIRLAIGARAYEVLLQFLLESILLCSIGGVVGIVLGLGGAYAAGEALGLPFRFLPHVVAIAALFSSFIGVVFGFVPARRAARLNPIEALRHE
jgi:putative ABC transport system permease protein